MSILENLLASIETLNANVATLAAAMAAGGVATSSAPAAAAAEVTSNKPAASGKGGKGGKATAPAKVEPKYTVEEVAAAAVRVKDEIGTAAAQELIKSAGKADKLKEMKPENFDAFVEAAEALLAEQNEPATSDDL
jgi:hypothetical protein